MCFIISGYWWSWLISIWLNLPTRLNSASLCHMKSHQRRLSRVSDLLYAIPSSGGIHIVQILNFLENFDMKQPVHLVSITSGCRMNCAWKKASARIPWNCWSRRDRKSCWKRDWQHPEHHGRAGRRAVWRVRPAFCGWFNGEVLRIMALFGWRGLVVRALSLDQSYFFSSLYPCSATR